MDQNVISEEQKQEIKEQKAVTEPEKQRGQQKAQRIVRKLNQDNITNLVQVIHSQKKEKEPDAKLVSELLNQIQELSQNYNNVFHELQDIKIELNQIKAPNASVKQMTSQVTDYESEMQKQYMALQSICESVDKKAGNIVNRFTEIGVRALDKVCDFLGVKEALVKMRDTARSNAEEIRTYIENVDSVKKEMESAGNHMKNINDVIGNDAEPADLGQDKIFKSIKSHYQKEMKFCEKRAKKLDSIIQKNQKRLEYYEKHAESLTGAIDKTVQIEQAARASVRVKLKDNKAIIVAKEATEPKIEKEKEKPLQATL